VGQPVVKPPTGADVYLLGRLWQWWPILELEKGVSHRIHISSLDWMAEDTLSKQAALAPGP
jgi:cytochrome c oxidase subunit 2